MHNLHAQSENFITPRHYVKNCDARKSFMIDRNNQFQSLENVIEEQSNNNELNMAQETTNNPQNNPTMTAEKSVEKLPSSTDFPTIILFHLMQTIASIISEDLKSKIKKKNIATISANPKKYY